jgi:hypothetical protein
VLSSTLSQSVIRARRVNWNNRSPKNSSETLIKISEPGLRRLCIACLQTASNQVINVGVLMPPVAFDPIPPSTSVDPVTRNPFGIMVRIVNVVAGNPNIAASVPPPVSRIPNMIVARRWRRGLNPYCRRGHPDNNFICRRLGRQAQHTADHYYPGKSTARASNPVITHT